MDDQKLAACQLSVKEWKCPVCSEVLSRKQTLKDHLYSKHEIFAGPPVKRYKLYDYDDSMLIPKSTRYSQKQVRGRTNNIDQEQTACTSEVDNSNSESDDLSSLTNTILEDRYESDMDIESENEIDDNDLAIESENEIDDPIDSDDCGINEPNSRNNENLNSDEKSNLQSSKTEKNTPVYVIPARSEIYFSSISRFEHVIATSGFAARHNLSDTAIKDLLTLLQLHMPENNTGETNINVLKNECGFDNNYMKFHLYCDACKKTFSEDAENCMTPGCTGMKSDSQCKKYFITSNIKQQLTEILQREGIWKAVMENLQSSVSSTNICDVRNGYAYKKLFEQGGFLHKSNNITFSMFTDGVPLFKSSGVQMWPVYILINEIPPKQRFLRKNMLLWGVWQGKGKPKMNMFLRPLISDLCNLYNEGFSITIDHQEYNIKAMLLLATMDLQARAYVTGMTQHNGEYGCLYCEEPGAVVSSGAGNCRSYVRRDPTEPASRRTDQSVREQAKLAHQSGKRHTGFVGLSVFHYLPYFSMTKNIVIDYMHGVLLGITKKLIELWFDNKYSETPHYIGQITSEIDRILRSIQPPYLIHRLPRIITGTFQHWKASELRNWLLFYSVPCLEGYLPVLYFKHFCCLVEAVYILLSEGITSDDITKADKLLNFFVENAGHLYGKNFVSLNVHNLIHLTEFVNMWGPLWCWSCFPFESFNGEIKKNIHGTGNVCRQIFWTFQAQKRIMQTEEHIDEGKVKEFIQGMFGSKEMHVGKEAYRCRTVQTRELKKKMDEHVKEKLKKIIGNFEESDFLTASKVIHNGFYMYSSKCTKVKKQNSYTVAFERRSDHFAIEIEEFLVHSVTRCVFAVGKLFKSKGNVLDAYTPHIHKLEYRDRTVVKVQDLCEPVMVVKKRNQLFGALFPNHFERD